MSTTFDLSTLGLPEGTHSITVKARASGYEDSAESNAVSYVVETIEGSQGLAYTLSDDGTYYICSGIGTCTDTDIVIGNYHEGLPVKEIGEWSFNDSTSITSVTIANGVLTIGDCAFVSGDNITSVTIPDSVTRIGKSAFNSCHSLARINIPSSVTIIDAFAFRYCKSLTSITIPNSVTNINQEAFQDCVNLTELRYNGTKVQWSAISKGENWNDSVPATYVQCTDGNISLGTYTLSGTWVFDQIIDVSEVENYGHFGIEFISNGIEYDSIYSNYGSELNYSGTSDDVVVYRRNDNGWIDTAYRTITLVGEQIVDKEFYDWFTANATEVTVGTKSLNINVTNNEWGNVAYFIDKYHIGNNADGKTNGIGSTNLHNIKDFVVLTNDNDLILRIESYKNCSINDTWSYTLVYNIQNDASITLYTDD